MRDAVWGWPGNRVGRKWTGVAFLLLALSAAGGCEAPSRPTANDVLQRARETIGGAEALGRAGTVQVFASGTLDKSAERQGFSPDAPSPAPFREVIGLDGVEGGVSWDYWEERFDGTSEAFGEAYPTSQRHVIRVWDAGVTVAFRGEHEEDAQRQRRRFPQVVVEELVEDSASLTLTGPDESGEYRVSGQLGDGSAVELRIDSSGHVRELAYPLTFPGYGAVTVAWQYDDYREVSAGLRIPHRYSSTVNDLSYSDLTVDSVIIGSPFAFLASNDLRVLPERDAAPPDQEPGALEIFQIGEGLYRVPEVRGGFAPLVVELSTSLAVVDAPASFPLLGLIPAGETDPGASMSWASERLIDALRARWPDRPVSHLILTHHHADHIGGVRAFVAEGATVLGPQSAIREATRLVELGGAVDDRLGSTPHPIIAEVVGAERTIGAGERVVRLIPVGANPHSDGMLVVALPGQRLLYVSDLLTPGPVDRYPAANHESLDRFFGEWLRRSPLTPDSIWTMHGSGAITDRHLVVLGSSR